MKRQVMKKMVLVEFDDFHKNFTTPNSSVETFDVPASFYDMQVKSSDPLDTSVVHAMEKIIKDPATDDKTKLAYYTQILQKQLHKKNQKTHERETLIDSFINKLNKKTNIQQQQENVQENKFPTSKEEKNILEQFITDLNQTKLTTSPGQQKNNVSFMSIESSDDENSYQNSLDTSFSKRTLDRIKRKRHLLESAQKSAQKVKRRNTQSTPVTIKKWQLRSLK